jgi:activator of HSP90 ATPase
VLKACKGVDPGTLSCLRFAVRVLYPDILSRPERHSSPVEKADNMPKTLITAASLPAPPERLFDMYLDPAEHAAFTGKPVVIGKNPASSFRAFEGAIWGTILHTEPKRLIVQTWRSVNFPAVAGDSILVLSFCSQGDGGRIELTQVNVADEDFAGVSHGWEKYYWTPWRSYLGERSANK